MLILKLQKHYFTFEVQYKRGGGSVYLENRTLHHITILMRQIILVNKYFMENY